MASLRKWLLFSSIVVALAGVWLALRAPRTLAHLPVHERIMAHAVVLVFSYVMKAVC